MMIPVKSRHSHGTSFFDLPPELLTAIFVLVSCPTVVRCRLVNRRLRDLINASLELEYQIELARDGMIDRPASGPRDVPLRPAQGRSIALAPTPGACMHLTTSEHLVRLRELRKAWTTLRWTRCVSVPMPGPCCAYELVGGVFCKLQPAAGGGWGGAGWGEDEGEGEDGRADGWRTMSLTWLPGPQAHDPGHTVVRNDLALPTRDFALDPSQDLMVLFKGREGGGMPLVIYSGELELHLRTISTNQTHPKASVPVLSTLVLYPVTNVFVQIVDDVVGMMYCIDPERPQITIWNWRTGHLVVDRTSGGLPPGTWDLSFIHSRALLLTSANGSGSLELFTFTCDPALGADSDSLVHVASLYLPAVHPSVRVLSIGTHTGPFVAGCPPGAAFMSSNEERIFVLTVQYVNLPAFEGPRTRPRMAVVVHQRALQRYLGWSDATATAGAVVVVPWSEWGRTHARVLFHVGTFQWLRYVHGHRFAMLHPASKAGRSTLQVLDFNVRRAFDAADDDQCAGDKVKHDKRTGAGDETDPSLGKTTLERVDYPTHVVMPNIFVDVVESGLPYREARRDVLGDYSGVMIDDERLVGLKYSAFLTGDMREIDVFTM